MKKRSIATLLALVLSLSIFAGCGKSGTQPEETAPAETAEVTPEATPETTDKSAEEIMAENMGKAIYERYSAIYAKHDPDDIVMTINGEPVTWSDYFFWFYSTCCQYETSYNVTDWSAAVSETDTYEDLVKASIEAYLTQFWVTPQKVKELGITLTDEDLAAIEAAKQSDIADVADGDEAVFEEQKQQMFLSDELYDRLMSAGQYYTRYFTDNFGAKGEKLSDEDVIAFAVDKGYAHVKHILVLVDSDATEEQKAEKLKLAEDILAQLKAAPKGELETKFDELMNEYSEDPGLASYPGGYYFTAGQMYQEFEDASFALEENGLSEIVESKSGYHIILRLPLNPDDIFTGEYTLRYAVASELSSNTLTDWVDSAVIEYTDMGKAIDLNDLFGFVPTESAEETPEATTAPEAG